MLLEFSTGDIDGLLVVNFESIEEGEKLRLENVSSLYSLEASGLGDNLYDALFGDVHELNSSKI